MGDEPDEYEAGIPCAVCWGPGGPWEGSPTPKFVSAGFGGITLSEDPVCVGLPSPPEGLTIVLEQIGACVWYGEAESDIPPLKYTVTYQLGANVSALEGRINGGVPFFQDSTPIKCKTSFTNELVPPGCYSGGNGSVS